MKIVKNYELIDINESTDTAYDSKGKPFTSASRLVSMLNFNGLKKIPPFILEKARLVGEDIDVAVQSYFEFGESPKFRKNSVSEKLWNQYLKFLNDHNLNVIATQALVIDQTYNTYGYIDLIANVGKVDCMIEIKTRNTKKTNKPRLSDRCQSLIYFTCKKPFVSSNSYECILLELSKDDDKYRVTNLTNDKETIKIVNNLKKMNKLVITDGSYREVFHGK